MSGSRFLVNPFDFYSSSAMIARGRVGQVSSDRSAVVGKNNWCFIYDGTNNYREAYFKNDISLLSDQWIELIYQRKCLCESLGVQFIQVVVPNKATIMPENYPESLGMGITNVLRRILDCTCIVNILCPIDQLCSQELKGSIFRRNDSHLTIAGNIYFVDRMLSEFKLSIDIVSQIEICKTQHIGDLGGKFEVPIAEVYCAPRFDIGLLDQSKIEKTCEVIVDGFNGTRQSFHNPNAPIKKCVLVFGNSFFEKNPSWGMSPVFVALFENFHFVWTPHFFYTDLILLKPDYVICQTCERFLSKVAINFYPTPS